MIYLLTFIICGLAGLMRGGTFTGLLGFTDEQFPDKGTGALMVFLNMLFVTVFMGMGWPEAINTTAWVTAGWYIFFSMGAWEMSIDLLAGRDPREHEAYGRDLAWDIETDIFKLDNRLAGFFGLTVNGLVRVVPLFFLTQSFVVLFAGACMGLAYAPGLLYGHKLRRVPLIGRFMQERKFGEFVQSAIVVVAVVYALPL